MTAKAFTSSSNKAKMKHYARAFAALFALLFAVPVMAGGSPQRYECPASIDVTETAADVADGWSVTLDQGRGGHGLEGVGFYDGHPEQMASLVPAGTARVGKTRRTTWRFPSDSVAWISCSYRNTNLLVARALPEGTRSCELHEEQITAGKVFKVTGVVCR